MGMDDNKTEEDVVPVNLYVLAEELLEEKVDFASIDWHQTDERGFTVLHCLLSVKATPEREEKILSILNSTTNVFSLVHTHQDNVAPTSTTPLYLAIVGGYYRVWPYLLQKGANVNQPSRPYGDAALVTTLPQYPFWVACDLRDTEHFDTIIENIMQMFEFGVAPFVCLNKDDWSLFCQLFGGEEYYLVYAKLLKLISLETLLTRDVENKAFFLNGYSTEKLGWLALYAAVQKSNISGIDELIKKGVPLVWRDKHISFLDIYFASTSVRKPKPDVVTILVENGCNPSVKPQFADTTALTRAINMKNVECLKAMLKAGKKLSSFNIDFKNEKGQTPLWIACDKDEPCQEVIEVLLSYGADPSIPCGHDDVDFLLDHCCYNNKLDIALLLLEAGASLDNNKFYKLLDYAVENKDNEKLHDVALAAACTLRSNILESTISALDQVRDIPYVIQYRTLNGTSFLHVACAHGNKSTVIYLVQQNLYINQRNYRGNLPLHTAMMNCHEDVALLLLYHGSDFAPNGEGFDSLSIACLNDLADVALWIAKRTGNLRPIKNVGFNSLLACDYVCTEYVRWATENCRRSGATSFIDAEFPPTDASLWLDRLWPPSPEVIEHPDHWKPAKRMCFQPSLFGKNISLSLIEQGSLGTCYLLGAIALLTTRPELLQDMFVCYDMELGIYGLRFFHKGRWTFVVIDGMIPCDKNGKPVYSCSKDPTQTYIMLLEKAYAKLKGSYEAIDAGIEGHNTMVELTGGVCKQMKFDLDETLLREAVRSRSIWKILLDHHRQGRLMTCQIERPDAPDVPLPNGLLPNHPYGILSLSKVDKQYLIQLHNPHGRGEWNGEWCEGSSIWKQFPNLDTSLHNKDSAHDGVFWMSYEDFIKTFNLVDVTHVVYCPKSKHNVGFTQHKNVDIAKGAAFAISSSHVPVQVTIEVRQHINDFLNRDSLSGEEMMLMVCTWDSDSYSIPSDPGDNNKPITLHGDLRTARIVERVLPTIDSKFALFFTIWHPHTPYFLFPLAMDKLSHLTCDVGIYTDRPVNHHAVTLLVPFWGGMELEMDERKKQELLRVKGRMQLARSRARGLTGGRSLGVANGKHLHAHHRRSSTASAVQSSCTPQAHLTAHGLPRSHSQSYVALSRTQPRFHTSGGVLMRPSSSPRPASPRSPHSPRSPRTSRLATIHSIHSTPSSPVTSPVGTSPSPRSSTSTPTPTPSTSTEVAKYKDKTKKLKELLRQKEEEIARLRNELHHPAQAHTKLPTPSPPSSRTPPPQSRTPPPPSHESTITIPLVTSSSFPSRTTKHASPSLPRHQPALPTPTDPPSAATKFVVTAPTNLSPPTPKSGKISLLASYPPNAAKSTQSPPPSSNRPISLSPPFLSPPATKVPTHSPQSPTLEFATSPTSFQRITPSQSAPNLNSPSLTKFATSPSSRRVVITTYFDHFPKISAHAKLEK